MEIIYLGHACFKLKGKNASVIADPYGEGIGLKLGKVEADIVTVSHNHDDHNNAKAVKEARMVIDQPGEYELSGISIIGIDSYHDEKEGEERGRNIIFVFEIDGVRIAHLGDLGHKLGDKITQAMGNIDILLIPVGGDYTIGPSKALEIVRVIDPYIIVPMHYKSSGLDEKIFGKLEPVETFLKESGVKVENAQKLQVKKETLEEEQKIVVLEKR